MLQNWQNVLTRSIKTMRKNWLGRVLTEDEIRVPNLRYRAVEGMFDEAQEKAVRETIEVIAQPWQKPAWRETMERYWVEQMRRWAECGI
jgi:predicted GNAT family N-acyltransferase